MKIVDIPFDPVELVVDLDLFRKVAPLVRPRLVALGASMTFFTFPLQEMQFYPTSSTLTSGKTASSSRMPVAGLLRIMHRSPIMTSSPPRTSLSSQRDSFFSRGPR